MPPSLPAESLSDLWGSRDRMLCALVSNLCPAGPAHALCVGFLVRGGAALSGADLLALDDALAPAYPRARGVRRARIASARRHVRVSLGRLPAPA